MSEANIGMIKTGLHHWWPKGLSGFWVGDDDCVTRITPQGTELRSPPAKFGGITNGHAIKLGGPWSYSFESKFDAVDSRLPYLTTELLAFEAKPSNDTESIKDRLEAHAVSEEFLREIGLTLASLIVRSPRHRNTIALTTEYYRSRMGFSEPEVSKNLINMNLAHKFDLIGPNFSGGKYIIAYSDECEFIFGDGFYTNMAHEHSIGHQKTVTPITPVMTVIYTKPTRYSTQPKLMTIRLTKQEVLSFNDLVQIYSKDQLFYRSQKPVLAESFVRQEFLEFRYHEVPWLEGFLADAHQFRG
ncbi:hypothetical protein [Sinorhizobium mexicanum]|uniref:Uncharacterized protein n=1 Tax=Sinorhizobium mexicanum TaxID=375549 RepID=A0A859QIA5_9HYPH|nr:hypothetical protein [Sinorhizobium mexicanum]MBP1881946.1 hypothetical protein [Sinorhizobium mexicanum]QLL61680.1 hypothetical protein FKV68_09590 [Sinorhizobium mexicanum]